MEKSDLRNDVESTTDSNVEVVSKEHATESLHFIEDLETRRNAAGITTMAIGEETGGGWW